MEISSKKTKDKGFVVKYIFDDEEEYSLYIKAMEIILNKLPKEEDRNRYAEIINLFRNYYTQSDPYSKNKPAVTISEENIPILAMTIWFLFDTNAVMQAKEIKLYKEFNEFITEYRNLQIEYEELKSNSIIKSNSIKYS